MMLTVDSTLVPRTAGITMNSAIDGSEYSTPPSATNGLASHPYRVAMYPSGTAMISPRITGTIDR